MTERIASVTLALLAAVLLGAWASQSASAPSAEPPGELRQSGPVGGYEGWWNGTPGSGDASAFPQETVAVNTRTNTVVDAFSRRINDAGRPTGLADVNYTLTPDPAWPVDSVVIIDTATDRVIADFRVDANGEPLR